MSANWSRTEITKVEGAGNDFLIVDLRSSANELRWNEDLAHLRCQSVADLAPLLCERNLGLGADGLILLYPCAGLDFEWHFYNSDGSRAEMCGNAARAVVAFNAMVTGVQQTLFRSGAGTIKGILVQSKLVQSRLAQSRLAQSKLNRDRGAVRSGSFQGYRVEVEMPSVRQFDVPEELKDLAHRFLDTGVPHLLVPVKGKCALSKLKTLAQKLRHHPCLGKAGANVTFYKKQNQRGESVSSADEMSPCCIKAITYERGVENFTKACGTGAVAAAYSAWLDQPNHLKEIEVHLPGGVLTIGIHNGSIKLTGEARIIAKARFSLNSLKNL